MTKSAKQDTSNASAQAAETESAATTDADAAGDKADATPDAETAPAADGADRRGRQAGHR